MDSLGEKIRQLRKSNGISQEELAYSINVARQTISKWETNEMIPNSDKIIAMCKFFNISADKLLNDDFCSQTSNVSNSCNEISKATSNPKSKPNKIWLALMIFSITIIAACSIFFILFTIGYFSVVDGYTSITSNSFKTWFIILIAILLVISIVLLILLIVFRKKLKK